MCKYYIFKSEYFFIYYFNNNVCIKMLSFKLDKIRIKYIME